MPSPNNTDFTLPDMSGEDKVTNWAEFKSKKPRSDDIPLAPPEETSENDDDDL